MKWIRRLASRSSVIGELFRFLWRERLWWLLPMVTILLLFSVLLFFAQTSPITPFIYTLF